MDLDIHRGLLGIGGLAPHEILFLLDEAERWVELNQLPQKRDGGQTSRAFRSVTACRRCSLRRR